MLFSRKCIRDGIAAEADNGGGRLALRRRRVGGSRSMVGEGGTWRELANQANHNKTTGHVIKTRR